MFNLAFENNAFLGSRKKETLRNIEETNNNIRSLPFVSLLSGITSVFTGKNIFGEETEGTEGMSTLEIIGYTILGVGITGVIGYGTYRLVKFKKSL